MAVKDRYRTSLAPPSAESREAYVRLWNRLTAFWVYGADRWMSQDPGAGSVRLCLSESESSVRPSWASALVRPSFPSAPRLMLGRPVALVSEASPDFPKHWITAVRLLCFAGCCAI